MTEQKKKVEPQKEDVIKSPYDVFGTDVSNEEKGVVLDYGYFCIVVKRAGPNNKEFKKRLRRINDSKGKRIQIGAITDEEMNSDMITLFAETVVTEWKGVRDKEKNILPFTVANCIELFTNLPDLFEDVRRQAMDFQTFVEADVEEATKN